MEEKNKEKEKEEEEKDEKQKENKREPEAHYIFPIGSSHIRASYIVT